MEVSGPRRGSRLVLLSTSMLMATLVLGACGGSGATPTAPTASGGSGASAAPSATAWGDSSALKVASGGAYLTDAAGRALYTYDNDSTMPACNGDCAKTWPPIHEGAVPAVAGPGVTKPIAGGERADGTIQVTYNGAWLYYFSGDLAPGDTKGDGQNGVWHLAKP